MAADETILGEIRAEVAALKRQNRRLVGFCLAAAMTPALMLAMGAQAGRGAQPEAGTQTAREFRLVDGSGKARAVLGMFANSPALEIYDTHSVPRAIVSIDATGSPWVSLFDSHNAPRSVLALDAGGNPSLELYDGNRARRSTFGLDPDGRPWMRMFDPGGSPRAIVALDAIGNPGIALYDARRTARTSIALDHDGNPFLRLSDGQDHSRAILDAGGSLDLVDGAGASAVLGVGSTTDAKTGKPGTTSAASLMMFDAQKRLLLEAPAPGRGH